MGGFSDKERARSAGAKSKPGKHKKTLEWEKLGDFITDAGAKRFAEIMQKSDEETFTDMYLKALNYFKPKITHQITEDVEPVKEIKFVVKK